MTEKEGMKDLISLGMIVRVNLVEDVVFDLSPKGWREVSNVNIME